MHGIINFLPDMPNIEAKRVLVRADLNVPLGNGEITNDLRIRALLPTLNWLRKKNCQIGVISHLGRPEGKRDSALSLRPVAKRLGELLGCPVDFCSDNTGPAAINALKHLKPSGVVVMENLRFDPRETSANDQEREALAKRLAQLAEILVSDGFGAVHRKQASVYDLGRYLPSCAGFLLQKELEVLEALAKNPPQPFCLILGGSKVSDKIGVISSLLPKVNSVLIGGGMVFTFLLAQGKDVAGSLVEPDLVSTCKAILTQAKELGVRVVLPRDVVMAKSFDPLAELQVVKVDEMANNSLSPKAMGLDIGPESSKEFASVIERAKCVFWNGPMGVFEFARFARGTKDLLGALAKTSAQTIVGGGDSVAALYRLGFSPEGFSYLSTGGGAALELLEGRALPGLRVLA